MLSSESITTIMPAFIKAQGSFKPAVKDAINGAFSKGSNAKPSYVTLAQSIDAVEGALRSNDIALVQQTDVTDNGGTILITRLIHASGEWIAGRYPVHPVKNDPQGEGSALTYARRYALMALVGIAPEDDDGNAATAAATRDNKAAVVLPAGRPMDGVWEAMNEEEQAWLLKVAGEVVALFESGDVAAAHDHIISQNLGADEKAALWSRLASNVRTALKKADAAAKAKTMEKAA